MSDTEMRFASIQLLEDFKMRNFILSLFVVVLSTACVNQPATTGDDDSSPESFTNGNPDPIDGCYEFPKYDYGCEHQTGGTEGGHVYAWECGSADGTPADEANEGNCYRIGYLSETNYAWCCTEGE